MTAARDRPRHGQQIVLDSSALLAALLVEPGGDVVADVMSRAIMSSVNATEVVSKLTDRGLPLSKALQAFGLFRMEVVPFDLKQSMAAAALRQPTQKQGLSLADRACLALAQERNLAVMTADKVWSKLDLGIQIEVIR